MVDLILFAASKVAMTNVLPSISRSVNKVTHDLFSTVMTPASSSAYQLRANCMNWQHTAHLKYGSRTNNDTLSQVQ